MTTTRLAYSQELHDRLKELHTAASPAPWGYSTESTQDGEYYDSITDANKKVLVYPNCVEDMEEEDTNIIIEARNALPALLAEIKRLQKENKIYGARLARVNEIAPATYLLALSSTQKASA